MYRNTKDYYSVAGVSAEDVIDSMNMLHREGAALKYLFRCNKINPKGDIKEDMKKCRHYLARCLQFEPIPRDATASYWLEQIDSEVFDEDIYLAIVNIINAVGNILSIYNDSIGVAIYHVDRVLERY